MDISKKCLNYKIIAILSILFSTVAIAIAFQNPAQGYEISIYDSTPFIVWICLFLSITGALFLVLYQVSTNKYVSSNFWTIGIFILLLNRLIILYIPYIRGYFSWREDNISHVGYLIDIIASGHISSGNYYPITHILLAMFYTVTEISQNILVNYSTGVFSIFYVILVYLLATVVLHTKKEQILAVTSVVIVFFSYNVYLMPNGWSQLFLPIVVFLYFKSLEEYNFIQYKLLFVILLIIYPFFHPLSSFYFIFMLTYFGIAFYIMLFFFPEEQNYNNLNTQRKEYKFLGQLIREPYNYLEKKIITISTLMSNNGYRFPFTAILIETIILNIWILSFQAFKFNLREFYNSILTGTSPDIIGGMQNTLSKINLSAVDFLKLLIMQEGTNLIFLGLFVVSLFILIKKRHDLQTSKRLLVLSGIIIFTVSIYAGYMFGVIPGLHAIAAERFKSYTVLFTPISAGFVFAYFLQKKLPVKKVNLFSVVCVFIILIASTLSVYSLYPSPNVIHPNFQITQMDMQGTEWFIHYHNKEVLTTHILSPLYRFTDGVVGPTERNAIFGSIYNHTNVPDHFNYHRMNKLGESYSEDKYMMITMFDTVVYDTVWSRVGRFSSLDFDRLLKDTSVEKLYSNGETEIFFIHTV